MRFSLLVVAGLMVAPAAAQDSFDPGTLTVGEHVFVRRTLANGLQAIAVHEGAGADESSDGQTCSIFMVVGAGNRMEGASTTGLAHLVEHTMFTGTEVTGVNEHEQLLVSWGAESNAFTREDYTLYYDHGFPAEHMATVLEMEADRLRNLTFDEAPFLHERYRLEHEEQGAFTQATARGELLDAALFRSSSYGAGVRREDGTTMAVDLPIELVRAFYDQWYHPSNVAVVVAGAVDPEAALDQIEAAFGALDAGPAALPIADEPTQSRGGSLLFASSLPTDKLYRGWIGPSRRDSAGEATDRIALYLVASVLNERHRGEDGRPISASMGGRAGRDLFLMGVSGVDASDRLSALRAELDAQPVTAAELADAVSDMDGEFAAMAIRARPYFSLAATVGTYAVLGDAALPAEWPGRLAAITAEDAAAAVARWLPASLYTSVTFLAAEDGVEIVPEGPNRVLPTDAKALAAYAEDAAEAGDLEGAILAYEQLLNRDPSKMNAVIYGYYLGELKRDAGDLDGALVSLRAALVLVDYPAVRELADEIEAELADGAKSKPLELGKPTEAVREPAQVAQLPDAVDELTAFAADAAEVGDTAGAIAAYEKLLTKQPTKMNAVIYGFYLGELKRDSGDRKGAIESLNAALEVVDYPAVRELRDEIERDLVENPDAQQTSPHGADTSDADSGPSPHGAGVAPQAEDPRGAKPRLAASGARAKSTSATGLLAPLFADEANAVLADLEGWRGLAFTDDLIVEFVPKEDASTEGLNGWYEPDTKRLVVVENDNAAMGRGTMLHEMFHALQDQRFDLLKLHVDVEDKVHSAEADRALRGIIEGEAMLAVAELMDYNFAQHTALPMDGELDEARFEKVFHYGAGLTFIKALRDAGGWAQVDRAFRSPPTNTAQIMHPDRYLAGWVPEDLSAISKPECGCDEEPSAARVLGEFGLSIYLARDLQTRPDSARIAARLSGDLCYTVHDEKSGEDRWAWYLSFFDELAATDFLEAAEGLGLESWPLDDSGRRLGVLLPVDPLPDPAWFDDDEDEGEKDSAAPEVVEEEG
jgi:zinc protease